MDFDTRKRYYVYIWKIDQTGEVFYVGKGCKYRYATRKRENRFFNYMVETHDCHPEIIAKGLDEKQAFDLEKKTIAKYRKAGARLTNVQDGGENPPKLYGKRPQWWKDRINEGHAKFVREHPEFRKQCSDNFKAFLQTEKGKEFRRRSNLAKSTPEFKKKQSERIQMFCRTEKYRKNVSDGLKRYFEENGTEMHSGANNPKSRPVDQYTVDGTFVARYVTVAEAAKANGLHYGCIARVARGERKTAGGFVWVYPFENPVRYSRKPTPYNPGKALNSIPVLQCDKDGNVINEYPSITCAAKILNCERANIMANLKGRTKSAYGYVWKYKHDNTVPSHKGEG